MISMRANVGFLVPVIGGLEHGLVILESYGSQQSDASIFIKFAGCLSFVITIYYNPDNRF